MDSDAVEKREAAIAALMRRSESELESFFFSRGLGPEFHGPAPGWGRQKRINSALMAAEQRGDLDDVLRDIEERFGPMVRPTGPSSKSRSVAVEDTAGAPTQPSESRPVTAATAPAAKTVDDSVTTIFLVHGHNALLRTEVARLVERTVRDVELVILHEQPNQGRTIIEKFEHHASSAGFAIILLTADDEGSAKGTSGKNARARQNVILELGYFIGTLGRSQVAVIYEPGVELPSDIMGVVYIQLDAGGAWKLSLAQELSAAGLQVNFSKIR
jgi:predicted nucleotide-binding protein